MKAAPRGKTALAPKANQMASFSTYITAPATTKLLEKVLSDSNRVTRLVSTLISAVSSSDALRACKPETILSAALKGESNGLNLALNQFYLVPFKNVCTYIPSHKGLIQLAIRTGQYEDLDVFEVRQGEYKGRDSATGRPSFQFETDDDKREELPIIGYYAYFRLKSGFSKGFYWSMTKLLKHADRYSRAFDLDVYKKYISGARLTDDEEKQVDNGPWYGKTGAQGAMCEKTVMKALLNSGYAPLSPELIEAIESDADEQPYSGAVAYNPQAGTEKAESEEVIDITQEPEDEPERAEPQERHARSVQTRTEKTAQADVSAYDAFFGGTDDNNPEEQ